MNWYRDMKAGRQHNGEVLLLLANGWVMRARWDSGLEDETGRDCWGWQASIEGAHPLCWDDGICWSENSEGDESIQPVAWVPFDTDAAA